MRLMRRIEGENMLAKLFNKFMGLLSDCEIILSPNWYSMKEYQQTKVFEGEAVARSEEFTFQSIVLSNSLNNIHDNAVKAAAEISKYLNEFSGDWKYYACLNRVELIRKFGGEDTDYNADGTVMFRDNNESLRQYTIYSELKRFIEHPDGQTRGEFVGTSHPSFFDDLFRLAANKNDLNIMHFFRQQGEEITEYTKGPDGELKPLSTIERLEKEGYEDILNYNTVELVRKVLNDCQELAALYQKIDPFSDSQDEYEKLLEGLNRVINLEYKSVSL